MAKHGIGFMQLLDAAGDFLDVDLQFARQLFLLGAIMRHELVQRRVDQADSDRVSIHGFEDANEVASLKRQ